MGFRALQGVADVNLRAVLGEDVIYTPGVGDPVTVDGIFDEAYVRVDVGQPGLSSTTPAVWLSLDDLPSDPTTDSDATVTINGTTFTIHDMQPDGMTGIVLLLHRLS